MSPGGMPVPVGPLSSARGPGGPILLPESLVSGHSAKALGWCPKAQAAQLSGPGYSSEGRCQTASCPKA